MCIKIKMSSLFLISLLIINLISVGSLIITKATASSNNSHLGNSTSNKKLINVYVNSSIYANISYEIAIYAQDLQNEGYDVQVFNCSSGEPGALDLISQRSRTSQ